MTERIVFVPRNAGLPEQGVRVVEHQQRALALPKGHTRDLTRSFRAWRRKRNKRTSP